MFSHKMNKERSSAAMAGVRCCSVSAAALKTLAVLSVWILWPPASGAAEYRLDVGDVLEISVAGVPDLRQRVSVELDGNISFPLLGTLEVGGLAPSEVRAKIQAILPTKVFRQRGPDGRDNVVVLDPDQITVNVVEYRPVYVNGDVSKPGEQVYRPRMTVRQAIAQAGGYEVMRFRMNNPFLESADLRSEYESLWTDFAKEQAHIWRMKAELGETNKLDPTALRDVPIPATAVSEIVRLETEQLKSRQDDFQREKDYLLNSVKKSDEHNSVLTEQLKREEQGVEADTQDLQRAAELFSKGAVPIQRMTDARRGLLLSSTRRLQTVSQLIQIQKQKDDSSRQLQRFEDQRRFELLHDLQDSNVRLNQIRSRLQGVGDKITYTGIVRSQLARGAGGKPELMVVRKADKGRDRIPADEDFELQPGDVVEVALRDVAPSVPSH
jgi:polysaccharide export outer membrane protein